MKLNLLLLSAIALVNATNPPPTSAPTSPPTSAPTSAPTSPPTSAPTGESDVSAVELGTAGDYVILAKTGISTVPTSAITGDIAVSPIAADAITGFSLTLDSTGEFSTSSQLTGNAYASDYSDSTPTLLTTAVSDMETAYTDAAGRTNTDASRINLAGGLIGGLTLTPGIYTFDVNIIIETDITLSGSSTDVFIIQTTGYVVQAANKMVILINGVLPENIFWQVAGHVAVGTGATMKGILLVKTDVTFKTGSALTGRILAQTACNLQMATITEAPASA
jgi:hypothetical protein